MVVKSDIFVKINNNIIPCTPCDSIEVSPDKDEYEFYMRRNNAYYFRNFYGNLRITSTEWSKEMQELKYYTKVKINSK